MISYQQIILYTNQLQSCVYISDKITIFFSVVDHWEKASLLVFEIEAQICWSDDNAVLVLAWDDHSNLRSVLEIEDVLTTKYNELRRCGELVRYHALKCHVRSLLQKADDFSDVRRFEWPRVVSAAELSTLSRRKQNKSVHQVWWPLCYLKDKISVLVEEMKEHPNAATWHQLGEVTLAQIMIFNKRRSGEV